MELRYAAVPHQIEEGDGNCCRLLRGAALQRNSTLGRRRRRQLPSPSSWSYAATQLHIRKKKKATTTTLPSPSSSSSFLTTQRRRRRRWQQRWCRHLLSLRCVAAQQNKRYSATLPSLICCVVAQLHKSKRCLWICAAVLCILCSAAPQTNKPNKRKEKKKDAYLGPMWVMLRL